MILDGERTRFPGSEAQTTGSIPRTSAYFTRLPGALTLLYCGSSSCRDMLLGFDGVHIEYLDPRDGLLVVTVWIQA